MSYTLFVQGKSAALVADYPEGDWLDLTISAEAYAVGSCRPNYPVPAMIGQVYIFDDDVIISDCDERFDPRLVIEQWHGKVYADYPHDSPNYR